MRWVLWSLSVLSLFGALLAACPEREHLSPEADRGKKVYAANCIACHNADPTKPGPVGPALKGSSRELIEARVMLAAYPAGYTPKRDTKLMVPLPQLANKIDDLAAFLR
jgi:mono/diheme cytochrome c family protein